MEAHLDPRHPAVEVERRDVVEMDQEIAEGTEQVETGQRCLETLDLLWP